jgi:hypothetical protein
LPASRNRKEAINIHALRAPGRSAVVVYHACFHFNGPVMRPRFSPHAPASSQTRKVPALLAGEE